MLMPAAPTGRADIPVGTAAIADLRAREFWRLDASGVTEHAFALPAARTRACLGGEFPIPRLRARVGGPPVGAVRASLGLATQPADIDRFIACIEDITARHASRSARGNEESRAQTV